jgi:hypothetical protein
MFINNSYLRLQLADPLAQDSQLLPHMFVLFDDLCLRVRLGHAAANAAGRPPRACAGDELCETVWILFSNGSATVLWRLVLRSGAQATKTTSSQMTDATRNVTGRSRP